MSTTITTSRVSYKDALQSRIVDLTERHKEILAEQSFLFNSFKELESKEFKTVSDVEALPEMQLGLYNNSATAAAVWDLKCEVEKWLSLYELENETTSYDLEKTANFISRCIDSCLDDVQLQTASKLIDGLAIIYKPTIQLTGWSDSLRLKVFQKERELHIGVL